MGSLYGHTDGLYDYFIVIPANHLKTKLHAVNGQAEVMQISKDTTALHAERDNLFSVAAIDWLTLAGLGLLASGHLLVERKRRRKKAARQTGLPEGASEFE